ncbi:DUF1080 domain-containing protein [Sphingobacterium sp. UT-1RO-CII-1]|uniref:DUF1080 domain-containing protein n=1 Tax=Sphingobacterium sp. UT-1RO-CII-1 TaxID=2995225 RepID=UPI00227B3E9F|nr:DUF1080 domain-containing protein [Sphingobacterium sp. UT-1RO-CII-1]MCY4781291.1 DUF1080 domain-containing protein [Sphingobacterium sp. UT-1RO-CII-1]
MKKVFNTLSALLILQATSYAQQPAHLTTATKIADVLAQQPAEENVKFLTAMNQLENFTADDIASLLVGLKPQGGDNAAIEYAANSYSFYVMQPGKDAQRVIFSQGLIAALDKLTDKDNKAFVFQLMKQASKDEAVDVIVPYLKDDFLVDKAAIALNAIRTPKAAQALSRALSESTSEKTTTAIVTALGDLQSREDEDAVIATLAKFTSENYQKTAYTALSKIAGNKSAPVFLQKLKSVNYQYDHSNIGGLTIDYANNLSKNGQEKLAASVATAVSKGAEKAGAATLQVGALQVLTSVNPTASRKQLMKAATSENSLYRTAALELLSEHKNAASTKMLIASLKKASPEVQESILNFLATEGKATDAVIIQNSTSLLKNTQAKIAALNTLSVLSNGTNANYLIEQIKDADDETVQALEALLLSSKDKGTVDVINQRLAGADPKTQLTLLKVLAVRTNAQSAKAVLPFVSSTDGALKKAALEALPNVVGTDDFEALVNILGQVNENEAKLVQRAIVISLEDSADKDSKIQRLAANISRSAAPSAANYFPVFAGVGGADAVQAVTNYVGNEGLKSKALASLASWSNPEVLPNLIALSRSEKGSPDFNIVFTGLLSQINKSTHTADQKTLLLKDAFALAENVSQKKAVLGSLQATNSYQALVFAAKYMDDADLKGSATSTAMNIAMDNSEYIGKDVRQVLEKAMANLSGSESSYLREAIVRHLAEMPQGEGYVSMFNGKDLTGWKGLVENPIKRAAMSAKELAEKQAVADQKMRDNWSAIDGDLVFSGHGDNIASIKQYGDFEMLVDWKLDPNGKEPDAGVYLRGTPQVQIWDVSRVDVGAQVGSGGLYNNSKHPKDPSKVADNAMGEWNTFKIKMVGEQVWVWLNGELVVDNITMENYWDRNQSIFPVEQIELQAHGSRVWYRDIFIKELGKKEIYTLSDEERKDGFEMLFDGTNLDKWTETAAYEITPQGYIRSNPDATSGKNLYTKKEYADFVYRFEFKLTPAANNGVGIRTPLSGDAAYAGMEIQILDNDAPVYKDLKEHQYHGSVYGVIAAKRKAMKPLGEWNKQEIRVQGSKIKVTLNGEVILDGDIAEASKNGTLDKRDHPGLLNKTGHIGFLGHGTEVFMRNIRVKSL